VIAYRFRQADTALAEVLRLVPVLPSLVEHSAHRVGEAHGQLLPEILDGVFADVFRAELANALIEHGIGSEECFIEPGNRNSIQLRLGQAGDVLLRVLKRPQGGLTPQPRSGSRTAEYCEQGALFEDVLPATVTVVWTWHVNRHGQVEQHLLMPKAEAEQDRYATDHWRIAIPDQLTALELLCAHEDFDAHDDLDDAFKLHRDEEAADDDDDGDDPA